MKLQSVISLLLLSSVVGSSFTSSVYATEAESIPLIRHHAAEPTVKSTESIFKVESVDAKPVESTDSPSSSSSPFSQLAEQVSTLHVIDKTNANNGNCKVVGNAPNKDEGGIISGKSLGEMLSDSDIGILHKAKPCTEPVKTEPPKPSPPAKAPTPIASPPAKAPLPIASPPAQAPAPIAGKDGRDGKDGKDGQIIYVPAPAQPIQGQASQFQPATSTPDSQGSRIIVSNSNGSANGASSWLWPLLLLLLLLSLLLLAYCCWKRNQSAKDSSSSDETSETTTTNVTYGQPQTTTEVYESTTTAHPYSASTNEGQLSNYRTAMGSTNNYSNTVNANKQSSFITPQYGTSSQNMFTSRTMQQ